MSYMSSKLGTAHTPVLSMSSIGLSIACSTDTSRVSGKLGTYMSSKLHIACSTSTSRVSGKLGTYMSSKLHIACSTSTSRVST